MSSLTRCGQIDVDGNLLAGLHADVFHFAIFHDHPAAFVQGTAGGDFVPILGDDHAQAGVAKLLFIGGAQENNVAIQMHAAAFEGDERGQVGGNHTFVVNRTAAPEITSLDDPSEGI